MQVKRETTNERNPLELRLPRVIHSHRFRAQYGFTLVYTRESELGLAAAPRQSLRTDVGGNAALIQKGAETQKIQAANSRRDKRAWW